MKSFKHLLLLLFFVIATCSYTVRAQQLQAQVSVNVNGYHSIVVPQEFRARVANNMGMLRLKDAKGNEVPFILQTTTPQSSYFSPIPYEQDKNKVDSTELFLIDTKVKKKNSGYIIQVANTDNSKKYRVEGSDDKENWFGIINNGILTDLKDDSQTFTNKSIQFPLVDYRYIRIILDDKSSPPIKVLHIGEIKSDETAPQLERVKHVAYQQTNNLDRKTTTIAITKEMWSPIDYFQIYTSTPKQYYRTAHTYTEQQRSNTDKRHSGSRYSNSEYLELHSNVNGIYMLQKAYPSSFFLEIENEDSPALQIDSIVFYQTPIRLIADMDKQQEYSLQADTNWTSPNYDLAKITLNLPSDIPTVTIGTIKNLETNSTSGNKNYGNYILVACSILGVCLVFYFGRGLIKDVNKDK